MTYEDDSRYAVMTRAVLEHLLKAIATMGSKESVQAMDWAQFHITKAQREIQTDAERDLLLHLTKAAVAITRRNGDLLELFLDALRDSDAS
jgi:uncharacterized membrane protein